MRFTKVTRRQWSYIVVLGLVGLAVTGLWVRSRFMATNPAAAPATDPSLTPVALASAATEPGTIEFPQESWQAAELEMQPVQQGSFVQSVTLTGKVALNEDRVAHIFPLVEGRVEEVKIKLGDRVKRGDLLVVVQSTEVGRSMLQLFQDRMQRNFAATKDQWTQTVASNTQIMMELIRSGASIADIEQQLTDRPMGEYRDKLMTAYVAYYKARKHLERLEPLSEGGSIAGKQLLEAEAESDATRATLQSLLEQLQQETQQASIVSTQAVKELETRVAVDETNLKILGFDDAALENIDPVKQGQAISHYPIYSPFDGTIISKDVVLLERVGPESQILRIADLSTVWVTTDIYEEHLPLLEQLDNSKIQLRSPAWPETTFEAQIFYTGDLVDESSRTVAMRAIADNAHGQLKPGMFVNVEFPSSSRGDVTQIPLTAVQDHAGETFVFVHLEEGQFERRNVSLGMRNEQNVEVVSGLKPGEVVVVSGGFALKSRMLEELLAE